MTFQLTDPITKEKISYAIDKKMISLLDSVKNYISKRDKDYVMLMDGYEGSGKTTFAIQCGKYVDPTLNLDRVCMTPDEFKSAIRNAKKGQCVIYDEAVTGLTAGASITRVGRILKSMMMQMRQKNLFVIVILPVVFEFNKYAVLSRARFFFHIYESKGRMGFYVGFNKKYTRMTYLQGKKTHSYKIRSRFNGRFYGKFALGDSQESIYRKKKEDALDAIGDEEEESTVLKRTRNEMYFAIKWINELGQSYSAIQKKAKEEGLHFSNGRLSQIIGKNT
ncbi:hypothetical protein LCGC14_0509600 [marine sediment metagenome]|uniref:Zona occludens toxin N-terminal domain-containing protein n=1 Tax=marine sediment metagenome TaxID=412755 RepID=A0A0F9S6G5_9ZZZZ|nr:hypothetical protein [bacterium]